MTTKRKASEFPPGINIKDGHAEIDAQISELPSQALMKCYLLKEVSLPLSVRIIRDHCFAQCTGLKKAEIPNSVEVIGNASFYYCTNLTDMTIAQDQPRLRVIGSQAFGVCRALKSIETPETVVEIGPKAFHACLDLSSATIHGSNLQKIEEEVFSGCSSLVEVSLPSSITSIWKDAFLGCRKLHTVLQRSQGQEGVEGLFLSPTVSVTKGAFAGCQSLTKPETTKKASSGVTLKDGHAHFVTGISELPSQALMKCYRLKEVSLPSSVRIIGDSCFAQCSGLKIAKIPNSVEVIEKNAFFYCSNMTEVIIAQDQPRLRVIGPQAFHVCRALKSIEAPESVVEIGAKAFSSCLDLSRVTIKGSNVRILQQEVFASCSALEEVTLPPSVTLIGTKAFHGCRKLHTISQSQEQQGSNTPKGVFLPSIANVGASAFEGCKSIESVVPSENLRILGYAAFKGCEEMKEMEFPEGLEVIENDALEDCESLEFARLPTTLRRIGDRAFSSCTSLQSVIFPPTEFSRLESFGHLAFGRCLSLVNICLPKHAAIQPNILDQCERLHKLLPAHMHQRYLNSGSRDILYHHPHAQEYMGMYHHLVGPFMTRFDRLPLLRLCYHQSYYPSEELVGRMTNVEMVGGERQTDFCGMTALHILALSKTRNLDVWKHLLQANPSNMMEGDNRGHLPLGHLLLNHAELAVLDVYFGARHASFPLESNLEYMIRNTFPYSRLKLRAVLRLSLDRWATNPSWKQALMEEIDIVCGASTSNERITRISHLQYVVLQKYQQKEMSALLELAIWNAKLKNESKERKSEDLFRQNCRLQCGDEVIIRNVLPFLQAPQQDAESREWMSRQEIADFRYDGGHGVRHVLPPPVMQPLYMTDMFGFGFGYEYPIF